MASRGMLSLGRPYRSTPPSADPRSGVYPLRLDEDEVGLGRLDGGVVRVLMVSHAYVVGANQTKPAELAKIPALTMGVVAPSRWKGEVEHYVLEGAISPSSHLFSYPVFFSGHIGAHCYSPFAFLQLRRFDPDIIHIEEEPWSVSAWQVMLATKLLRLRSKVIFFTWENVGYPSSVPYRWFLRFFLRRADFAIAGNVEARELLIRHGFPQEGTVVLPQFGVDVDVYRRRPSEELRRALQLGSFTIGYVGRLVPEKGVVTLLKAIRRLSRDFRLLLVGSGPLLVEVEHLAEAWGLKDRLVLTGAVPHREVPRYLNCMDVLVLPSITTARWKEQFGHVLIEAMACEVPVIGSNSGEIPHVIADVGLTFREGDEAELAEKLRLLMEDDLMREDLARRGRERVLKHYTSEAIAKKTYEVYLKVLEGNA